MRVLGVDPGLTRCGLGVVSGDPGRRLSAVAYGVLRTPATDDVADRLLALDQQITVWICEHQPDLVVVGAPEQLRIQSEFASEFLLDIELEHVRKF